MDLHVWWIPNLPAGSSSTSLNDCRCVCFSGACFESIQELWIVLHLRNLQKFLLQKFPQRYRIPCTQTAQDIVSGLSQDYGPLRFQHFLTHNTVNLDVFMPGESETNLLVAKPLRLVGSGNRELLLQPQWQTKSCSESFGDPKNGKKNVHKVQEGSVFFEDVFVICFSVGSQGIETTKTKTIQHIQMI